MPLNARLTRVLRDVRRWRRHGADEPIAVDPALPPGDLRRLSATIDAVIETRGGLAAARRRARTLALTYATLDPIGQERFFQHLATEHDRSSGAVDRAIDRLEAVPAGDLEARREVERQLRQALRPGYDTLLRRMGSQDGGLPFLVALRADLLPHRRRSPQLSTLDAELRQLLDNWFDVGLLELVRLTWDTSASLLEKLIEYEAVHAIESWDDLKRRLGPRRRCYAFLHPGMPDDPLIFVEVALTEGMPERLGPLLEPTITDPGSTEGEAGGDEGEGEERADTAVFYSISNCHQGLAGVSLGDFLIKSVAEELSAELGNLRTFVTLSPLPGFRAWLEQEVVDDTRLGGPIRLAELLPRDDDDDADDAADDEIVWTRLGVLIDGPARPADDPELGRLRPVIEHLAARYLTKLRPDGRVLDPVAHFHLSNGASIERLNWQANPSPTGWERGLGVMVNYRYDLRTIEDNHDRYVGEADLTISDGVRSLLQPRPGEGRRRWR